MSFVYHTAPIIMPPLLNIPEVASKTAIAPLLMSAFGIATSEQSRMRKALAVAIVASTYVIPRALDARKSRLLLEQQESWTSCLIPLDSEEGQGVAWHAEKHGCLSEKIRSWELSNGSFIPDIGKYLTVEFEGHTVLVGGRENSTRIQDRVETRVLQRLCVKAQYCDVGVLKRFIRQCLWDLREARSIKTSPKFFVRGVNHGWQDKVDIPANTLAVLPEGQMETLLLDIQCFKKSRNDYERRGLVWKRNYLLHGIPRSGKSSTVKRVAAEIGTSVFYLSLSGLSDDLFLQAIHEVPAQALVLLEDLDSCGKSIAGEENNNTCRVSLDVLLNVLDGPLSPVGSMFFITVNDMAALPEKLLQDGRINRRFEYTYATEDQIRECGEQLEAPMSVVDEAVKKFSRGDTPMATVVEFYNRDFFTQAFTKEKELDLQNISAMEPRAEHHKYMRLCGRFNASHGRKR